MNRVSNEKGSMMDSEKLWTSEFLGLGISNSMFYMTQYILVATLPLVILLWGGSPLDAGLAMTWFQVGTILSRPLAGRFINGCNKRVVLWVSTGLFLFIMVLFNFTKDLTTVFVLRGLHGAIFALGTTVTATLAVMVLPKKRRGEGVSMFAVFSNIAMVIGPALGLLVLDAYGVTALFWALTAIGFLSVYAANRKRMSDDIALPKGVGAQGWHISQFVEMRSIPWAIMGLLIGFCYSGMLVFVPIMLSDMGYGIMGSIFFALFALAIVASRPIAGPLYTKHGPEWLIYPGLVLFFLGLIGLGLSSSYVSILFMGTILGLGYGAMQPAFQALAVSVAPIERAGVSTATYFLGMDISVGLGATLLSVIASSFGFNTMYLGAAGVVLLAGILYHFILKDFSTPYENIR